MFRYGKGNDPVNRDALTTAPLHREATERIGTSPMDLEATADTEIETPTATSRSLSSFRGGDLKLYFEGERESWPNYSPDSHTVMRRFNLTKSSVFDQKTRKLREQPVMGVVKSGNRKSGAVRHHVIPQPVLMSFTWQVLSAAEESMRRLGRQFVIAAVITMMQNERTGRNKFKEVLELFREPDRPQPEFANLFEIARKAVFSMPGNLFIGPNDRPAPIGSKLDPKTRTLDGPDGDVIGYGDPGSRFEAHAGAVVGSARYQQLEELCTFMKDIPSGRPSGEQSKRLVDLAYVRYPVAFDERHWLIANGKWWLRPGD